MGENLQIDDQDQQTPVQSDPVKPVLSDEKKKELHGIVSKMILNKEPEENIKLVIDHYTKKNAATPSPEKQPKSTNTGIMPVPEKQFDAAGMLGMKQWEPKQVSTPPYQKQNVQKQDSKIDNTEPSGEQKPFDVAAMNGMVQFDPEVELAKAKQRHDEQMQEAHSTLQEVVGNPENLKKIARQMILDEDARRMKVQSDARNFGEGSGVNGNNQQMPLMNPFDKGPSDDQVNGFIQAIGEDNNLQRRALLTAKKVFPKEANKIKKAIYSLDSEGRVNNADKANEVNRVASKIGSGELDYNILNGQVEKKQGFGESFDNAMKQRSKELELFDIADAINPNNFNPYETDNASKEKLIDKLDETLAHNPDEPVGVPDGISGHLGSFAGGQGKVTAEIAAVNVLSKLAPGVGETAGHAASAALFAHEMGRRAYANELVKSYAEGLKANLPKDQALEKAMSNAKRAMIIDATTNAVIGKNLPALKGTPVANTAWYNNVVRQGFNFLKSEAPAGLRNAAVAGAGEVAKNISANIAGSKRDVTENAGAAAKDMLLMHYTLSGAMAVLGKLAKTAPVLYKKTIQGFSNVSLEDAKMIAKEQMDAGTITPQEAAENLSAIEQLHEVDNQIPKSVVNPEIRMKLQDVIAKRARTADEAKAVTDALKEPLKLKVEKYDERIKELASDPSAKQEGEVPAEEHKANVLSDATHLLKDHEDNMALAGFKTPEEKLKFIAQQAQNISGDGQKLNPEHATDAWLSTVDSFGDKLVSKAVELYPEESILEKPKVRVSYPNVVNVKLKDNASTIEGPDAVDVRQSSGNGEEMGSGNTGDQKPTGTQAEVKNGSQESVPRDEKIVKLESERDAKIRSIEKPEVNIEPLDEKTFPKVKVDKTYKGKKLGEEMVANPDLVEKHKNILSRAETLKKLINCLTNG